MSLDDQELQARHITSDVLSEKGNWAIDEDVEMVYRTLDRA